MANTDYKATEPIGVGSLYTTYSSAPFPVGTVCKAFSNTYGWAKFILLKGVASTAIGSAVTYDEAGVTALLAANAKGPVAFATVANTSADTYAWYCIEGKIDAKSVTVADNATVGRETADGQVGDARAAGDEIVNVVARAAQDTPASGLVWVQISAPPYVNDFEGA